MQFRALTGKWVPILTIYCRTRDYCSDLFKTVVAIQLRWAEWRFSHNSGIDSDEFTDLLRELLLAHDMVVV